MTVQWNAQTVLEVSGFSKRFGRFHALENVGFELRSGEVLGLIGPNGAGKTTLFECLAGVLPADAGYMRIGEKQIGLWSKTDSTSYFKDYVIEAQPETRR